MSCHPGNASRPISIDNDEENQGNLQEMLEAARNRAIIQQAQITNQPLDLCLAVAKTTVKGELQMKNREINKFILKYFQEKIHVKISNDFFYPKPEPDYSDIDAQVNFRQLIIYGVDFLTTNAIKDRLQVSGTQIQQIIWINGSTCKVLCRSEDEADRIFKYQLRQIKVQQDSQSFKNWHSIRPYTIFAFQRVLLLRYSLVNQIFNFDKSNKKYEQFLLAKKELPLRLLQHFNAVQKYRQVVNEIYQNSMFRRKSSRFQSGREYSRSRDRNRRGYRKHNEQTETERRQQRRNRNKMKDQSFDQIHKQNIYAHESVDKNYQDSFSILRNQDKQETPIINTDYSIDQSQKRNKDKINTSFANSKQKKMVQHLILYDHLSEADSNLSYNYNTMAVGVNKEIIDNRSDYHYSECQQSNSNADDLEYQLEQPAKKKTLNSSFFVHEKANTTKINSNDSFLQKSKVSRQDQLSNFFDFDSTNHPNKSKNESSLLNTSFSFKTKEQKSKKPISNFDDDYSY